MLGTIYSGITSGRISKFTPDSHKSTTDEFQIVAHPQIFTRDYHPSKTELLVNQTPQQGLDLRLISQ